jgi:hypothetical protein
MLNTRRFARLNHVIVVPLEQQIDPATSSGASCGQTVFEEIYVARCYENTIIVMP